MSQLLLLEPVGGIAGDMFLAAALDLGLPFAGLERALATVAVRGFRLEVARVEVGGIAGTHLDVVVDDPPARAPNLEDISALVRSSGLSARAKEAALDLFHRIARAWAKVNGVPLDRVRFEQGGALDSLVDICGAAAVLDLLDWPRVAALPPELGQGSMETAHGLMPVPQPIVLEILRGRPVKQGGPVGEAVTPTGAALLAGLSQPEPPTHYTLSAIGYGVGTTRWADRPNVLRMTLGEEVDAPLRLGSGAVVLLESNLDDCPGQLVARAIQAALEAGAVDAWASPCTMKKGRPGVVLSALAPESRRDPVARVFLAETTTLGVRMRKVERVELERELVGVETPYGSVRVKVGRLSGAVMGAHPEYEDCAARAGEHGVPVKEVMAAAMAAWRARAAR